MSILRRLCGGKTADEVLIKRFRIFMITCLVLAISSKLLYLSGITLPNMELILPVLVVTGSTYLWHGSSEYWKKLNRYFGVVVILGVMLIELIFWGPLRIYVFTWSGFLLVWMLANKNKISPFSGFRNLLGHTMVTAAFAILLFDFWTGVIGSPLAGFYGPLTATSTWFAAFIGQIPFTFYHLTSLAFIPPLVGFLKIITRVRIPVPVAVRTGAGISSTHRR